MRERLRIGEVADLLRVTPKAVRHCEGIGLLDESERSEAGYRLYSAADLLRLRRVKKLRALGLPLKTIKDVLGEPDPEEGLRGVLEALLGEVEGEIKTLQERRDRLKEMIAREDLEAPEGESRAVKVADKLLGGYLEDVSPSLAEQERRFWATLESFKLPEGYDEGNERLFRYYADHPEEYRKLLELGESLASLADLHEDDPDAERRAERLAEEFFGHFEEHPPPDEVFEQPLWAEGPLWVAMSGAIAANLSPVQLRVFELLEKRFAEAERRSSG